MTHGQLFGGIFGFGLAAQWAGIKNVWYNEIEHYPCEVVRARIADGSIIDKVKIYEQDIRTIGKHNLAPVDIISGGVPCQPASLAGKRKGTDDDRWLWPETIRVVSELKPSIVICENPPGILSLENGETFQQILLALENEGYEIEIFNIPACGVGAWHQRERIWIIAYSLSSGRLQFRERGTIPNINRDSKNEESRRIIKPIGARGGDKEQIATNIDNPGEQTSESRVDGDGKKKEQNRDKPQLEPSRHAEPTSNSNTQGLSKSTRTEQRSIQQQEEKLQGSEFSGAITERGKYWETEPGVGRMVHGIPNRVERLKGLGNAIVPQVAYEIFNAILTYDQQGQNPTSL